MPEKPHIKLSVRSLVEQALMFGDLCQAAATRNRAVEGVRVHQETQAARPETYQAEVPVAHVVAAEAAILEISGRIDGVYTLPDRVVVEEIKSTGRSLSDEEDVASPLHWAQLKAYAYMYAEEKRLAVVTARLCYVHRKDQSCRTFDETFERGDLEAFFTGLVRHFLDQLDQMDAWRGVRDAAIRCLSFPYETPRSGQRRMMDAVRDAIEYEGQLIIQAPTGIGKTMAALFPAIQALAHGHAERIFYLTARNTGKSAAEAALRMLAGEGLRLKSLTLTAKEKICFASEFQCDRCRYTFGYYDRLDAALTEAFSSHDAFTPEVISSTADKYEICPFEFSLDLSMWTDCIICDYNYAFDPRVLLKRHFYESDAEAVFLVDEAHNLPDRAREMHSAALRKSDVLAVRRLAGDRFQDMYKTLGDIDAWMRDARKRCDAEGGFIPEREPPRHLIPLLDAFIDAAEERLSGVSDADARETLRNFLFDAVWFVRVSKWHDAAYVTCYEKRGNDLRVRLFCMDPSAALAKTLKRCRAAVFFSATMTPADYFRTTLGCAEDADDLRLPSPFPDENRCILLMDRISTRYKDRDDTRDRAALCLGRFVSAKTGNYLLFFPSYKYMRMVHERFVAHFPDVDALIQTPSMREDERRRFLDQFTLDHQQTLAGFAVMGGIFGEGIDLVGDRLTGAAVVGVGLPGISPERDLLRSYFADKYQAGFAFAYVYPGINRVLQAAGRVIRSETDRGAILLVDDRFAWSRYQDLLPPDWRLIAVREDKEIQDVLAEFWGAPD